MAAVMLLAQVQQDAIQSRQRVGVVGMGHGYT